MGNVYKRGKNWYIDLYVNGRRIRKKVGKSKEVAILALKDTEVKAARNEFGFEKNDIPIEKLLVKFFDYSKISHSPTTFDRYKVVFDHFNTFLSKYPTITFISQINARLIDEYKIYRKDSENGTGIASTLNINNIKKQTRKGARA